MSYRKGNKQECDVCDTDVHFVLVTQSHNKPSTKCERGWQQHRGVCYLFSTNGMSWKNSRYFCQRQGGDLVKINSREEQSFLEYQLRNEMNFDDDKFWIGLTDSEQEGRWLWMDGSELDTSLAFWSRREPDDWKAKGSDGEDCASMGERAGAEDLKCWFDRPCYMDQSIISEKPA
ncbi:hypothetical protein Q5P01_018657 [Channa striata]|uniref:C-type lectin domain-containing protein n=1 Tax=Channa striata TaxID=64152 RepID=A0AA88M5M2_CHASR|nr:hypothetical protein Q5P01_018657 [Channa striata]